MDGANEPLAPQLGKYLVHVTRANRHELVEFELSLGDRDLTVELILPFPQFRELCDRYRAALSVSPGAHPDLERLAWRNGAAAFVAGAEVSEREEP